MEYPAKDARDIVDTLRACGHARFESVILTDAEATPARISALHQRLMASAASDIVVIFLAGHGALDDQGEYRFMAAGSDLDHPETGMPWSAIGALVDGIPARDRLILVDTCASGGEGGAVAAAPAVSGLRTRGIRHVAPRPSALPVAASFVDLDDRLGAQVVAACGADEVSLESGGVANGLFTAALRRGLADPGRVDSDGDGLVSAGELAPWLAAEVSRLSGGAQQPRQRAANPGRGSPVFLPPAAPGEFPPHVDRHSRQAWELYAERMPGAWIQAAYVASDPRLDRAKRLSAWPAFLAAFPVNRPGKSDDDYRTMAVALQALGGWPAMEPVTAKPSPLARPAWAEADGLDGDGPWCSIRIRGQVLVFRWCPGGPAPDAFPGVQVPAMWLAQSPLTCGHIVPSGNGPNRDDHPTHTAMINAGDLKYDNLLPELSKRLGATLRLPEPAWYARACAAGAPRITAQRSHLSSREMYPVHLPDVLASRPWGVLLTRDSLWLANPDGGPPLCCSQPEAWTSGTMSAYDEHDFRIAGLQPCILAE